MKKVIYAVLIAAICIWVYSCGSADAAKPNTPESSDITAADIPVGGNYQSTWATEAGIKLPLKKDGFEPLKEYYKQRYGLSFYSFSEVSDMAASLNMQLRPAEDFIPEIPIDVLPVIEKNYANLSNEILYYKVDDGWASTDNDVYICQNDLKSEFKRRDNVKTEKYIKQKSIAKYAIPNWPDGSIIKWGDLGKVRLLAPAEAFRSPRPIDPIAFVMVHDGYIELARW